MMIFLAILVVGFIYEWKKRARWTGSDPVSGSRHHMAQGQ